MAAVESNIGQGTYKIYYDDAYATDFMAKVISWEYTDLKNSKYPNPVPVYDVVLDKTAFFPEEGGQSPDKGSIEGNLVLDVQIKTGVIHHFLKIESPAVEAGGFVYGNVQWNHRFSNMQQHSAEHIFSGLVNSNFAYENVGFHLSDNDVTMDYNGVIPDDDIRRLETAVNDVIYKNIETVTEILPSGQLSDREYRSKIEIDGDVRIVTFPGYDVCACCAPHVKRTGEIGLFKVISWQNYKGGTRVHMLAGKRALAYSQDEHRLMTEIARGLTTSPDMVNAKIKSMQDQISDLKSRLARAGEIMLENAIAKIPEEAGRVCIFCQGIDGNILRDALKKAEEKHDICVTFEGSDEEGYKYIAASLKDATSVNDALKADFGARGGGQKTMMQGSVKAEADKLAELFDYVCRV